MTPAEFKNLFDNHFDEIRNYIWYRCGNESLASDIVQETFTKLWEKRPYKDKSNLRALLFKMAGDIFVSNYRKQNSELKFRATLNHEQETITPEEELQFNELKNKYEEALNKMPENQRVIFLMNRMEKKKYREIAEAVGIGIKAVEKRMSHALNFLRQEINW